MATLTDAQKAKVLKLAQLAKFKALLDTILDDKYEKPSTGIPSTDLSQAVQDALDAAGTALQAADLTTLNGKVAALEALIAEDPEATTHAIDKFNEIVAFLEGITDTQTLAGIVAGIESSIAAKYTKPSGGIPATDLAQGVQTSLGKADTALQSDDIADMAKKSEMSVTPGTGNDADKTTIQLKSGTTATVLTTHQDISGKADKSEMSVTPGEGANADKTTIQLKSGTTATVLTTHQDITGKVDKVQGKGLSTNDYSDADKAKLDAIDYASDSDIEDLFD